MSNIKIMLDAGHYGQYNRSPAVPEYYESDMAWKLHLYLKSALEKYGFEVGTTRNDKETDIDVYYRGRKAAGCDMFLSLHSNAVGSYSNENTVYPIVYRRTDDNSGFADTLANTVEAVMQTGANPRTGTRLLDNGNEYYGVLRGAKSAGCELAYIVEHSFHTATKPAQWLMDENNLQRLAEAEAEAVAEYFGIEKGEEEMTAEEKAELEALRQKADENENTIKRLTERITELENGREKVYRYWDEIEKDLPWAYEPLKKLYDKGIFKGESAADLNLSYSMVRMLVIIWNMMTQENII